MLPSLAILQGQRDCYRRDGHTTCTGMVPPLSRRAELERQLKEAEFECRYAMDKDRDDAADWRDSLQRQLDELKRIEDDLIRNDLMRDEDGNLVNARGFLDDDGNVIDD